MSLIDTDKNLDDRSNPTPNADDNILKRNSHETIGTTYRRTGSNVKPTLVMQQGAIQSYDSANRVNMFFGYNPALNATRPVLRVAKDGFDATTADSSNLIFNSEQNVLKIVGSGTSTITKSANTAFNASSISHGLNFIPAVIAFVFDSSSGTYQPVQYSLVDQSSGATAVLVSYIINSSVLQFTVTTPSYSGAGGPYGQVISYTIKYYLLQETAT